jgi:predicted transcriptional regulator
MAAGMIKVTLTLDDDTVARLRRTAARLGRPQSQVVREAIREYEARSDRLTEEEKARLLAAFDRLVPAIARRPATEVEAEILDIRAARPASDRRRGRRAGA